MWRTLKRDLPKLEINKTAHSAVYVNLIVLEMRNGGFAVCLSIELKRPVTVRRNEIILQSETLWQQCGITP